MHLYSVMVGNLPAAAPACKVTRENKLAKQTVSQGWAHPQPRMYIILVLSVSLFSGAHDTCWPTSVGPIPGPILD